MKIDIHTHTKKCKAGDSEHRNIDAERFDEIIRLTDVKILAITNHNHFDINQYKEIKEKVNDVCQIWPGIELDIIEEQRRAHLIVIANPVQSEEFSMRIETLLEGKTADNFNISINDTVISFDHLDVIYIAHYYGKAPNLINEDIEKLCSQVSNKNRVLKEASNSISAGIYINHGHNSIFGSDIQDWNNYHEIAKSLPDLRLPVESFEQFCLLLEKDNSTINTILDKKSKENLTLNVFEGDELIKLDIYNDINILFGSKGTGKTEILRSISQHYNDRGIENKIYESNYQRLEEVFDIKGANIDIDSGDFGIDECVDEIRRLRSASEKNVTALSAYLRYYSVEETNKISRVLKIKNFTQLDESSPDRELEEALSIYNEFDKFFIYIKGEETLSKVVGDELISELEVVLTKIKVKLKSDSQNKFTELKSISLFNQIISVFVEEIARKTGHPQKPISTGFQSYASNRIKLERDVKKINNCISQSITPFSEYVGDLGDKGQLFCETSFKIQDGAFVNVNYRPIKDVNKIPQRFTAAIFKTIEGCIYSESFFEKITEYKNIEGSESINSISDLLLFHRHFTINGEPYKPSTGESSMVLLYNELIKDKDLFIIDEPEKSLGNDYISDVIVPILKQHAQSGKRIVIATHDANIAVRTLPYNSIYREHGGDGYKTYSGNPFSNNLICHDSSKVNLSWKEISMKTLEGGKEAFGERGKIYGHS